MADRKSPPAYLAPTPAACLARARIHLSPICRQFGYFVSRAPLRGDVRKACDSGGLVCGILSDGHMKDYAYDGAGNCYQEHPNGIVFSKTVIPGFQKCVDLVKTLAPRLSRVTRLIGWDLTIDSYGEPILIEANMTWGGLCQIANGPIFGSLTPSILDYVAENSPYFK